MDSQQTGPLTSGGVSAVVERCCTKCGVAKPRTLEFFDRKKEMRDGLTSWCRGCIRERARLRQEARRRDPVEAERVREERRRYVATPKGREWKRESAQAQNHKRRSKTYRFSRAAWAQCKRLWGHRCAYCAAIPKKLTIDHVIPLSDPTTPGTVPSNVVPACDACNKSKGKRSAQDFASPARFAVIAAYLRSVADT